MVREMYSTASAGRVIAATCGVIATRGCSQSGLSGGKGSRLKNIQHCTFNFAAIQRREQVIFHDMNTTRQVEEIRAIR